MAGMVPAVEWSLGASFSPLFLMLGCILHFHYSPPQTKAQSVPAFLLSSFLSFCQWGVICCAVFLGN